MAKSLLDKYWRCETSVEEEIQLKEYFKNNELPVDLLPYVPLFRYYNKVSELKAKNEFMPGNLIVANQSDKRQKRPTSLNRSWYYRAAAIILIIVSVIVIQQRVRSIREQAVEFSKDTFSNPQDALKETKKMLLMISVKLNKGEMQAQKLSEFHKVEKLYSKNEK